MRWNVLVGFRGNPSEFCDPTIAEAAFLRILVLQLVPPLTTTSQRPSNILASGASMQLNSKRKTPANFVASVSNNEV